MSAAAPGRKRSRGDGSEGQLEALPKRRKADPARCRCRSAVLPQSSLRSRRLPRSAVLGLLGERCCARDRSRAERRALRLPVQQEVPVPRRRATPIARIEGSPCESWPRPSQTVAQQGPPHPSAGRVIFYGSLTVMATDILRCHAANQSGDHLQGRERARSRASARKRSRSSSDSAASAAPTSRWGGAACQSHSSTYCDASAIAPPEWHAPGVHGRGQR